MNEKLNYSINIYFSLMLLSIMPAYLHSISWDTSKSDVKFSKIDTHKAPASLPLRDKKYSILSPYLYSYSGPFYETDLVNKKGPAIQFSVSEYNAHSGYDNKGNKIPLAKTVFGANTIHLYDIYLASKLSQKGIFTLPGATPNFGGIPLEQYPGCLAPTILDFEATLRKILFDFDAFFRFDLQSKKITGTLGIHLPLYYHSHTLSFNIFDGKLSCFLPSGLTGEDSITQFFTQYNIDFSAFFINGILNPKNISFKPFQEKFSIGTIGIFGSLSKQIASRYLDSITGGIHVALPTSNTLKGNTLWEIQLATSGIECYASINGSYFNNSFNPFLYGAFKHPFTATEHLRIPQVLNQNSDIILPPGFSLFTIQPFSKLDTTVLWFADKRTQARYAKGNRIIIALGSQIRKIFDTPCDLTISYRYYHRFTGSIKVCDDMCTNFKPELLLENRRKRQHSFIWNLAFYKTNRVNCAIGMQHILYGQNSPKFNKFFTRCSVSF